MGCNKIWRKGPNMVDNGPKTGINREDFPYHLQVWEPSPPNREDFPYHLQVWEPSPPLIEKTFPITFKYGSPLPPNREDFPYHLQVWEPSPPAPQKPLLTYLPVHYIIHKYFKLTEQL